jgi:hypothetical protein
MLPNGRKLLMLRDAALHITKLPKAEHDAEEWQAATEALMLVVDLDGPTMFAWIGIMRALKHGKSEVVRGPRKKVAKKYQVIR